MSFSYLTGEVGNIGISKIKKRAIGGPVVYDPFDAPDGMPLAGRTPPIVPVGAAWVVSGNATIQSNHVVFTNTPQTFANIDCGIANHSVSAFLNLGGNLIGIGVIARYVDDSHFWLAYLDINRIRLFENNSGFVVRGTYTGIISNSTDHLIELRANGNDLSIYLAGLQIIAYSSALFNSATKTGLYADYNVSNQKADDFTVTSL